MTPTRQRVLIAVLIVIGVAFVGFFGMRFFHALREFRGHRPPHFPRPGDQPAQTDVELIRDWMTIPYIESTYRLPPNLLYETLNIQPNGNGKKSLKQLNEKYYPQTPGIVLEKVKAAILANQPTPTVVPIATAVPAATGNSHPVRPGADRCAGDRHGYPRSLSPGE